MNNDPMNILCPKCQTAVSEDMKNCPGCGYAQPTVNSLASAKDESREGAGPFSFAYEEVQNVYKFKPSGNVSKIAIQHMLVLGLFTAVIGGPVLFFVIRIIGSVAASFLRFGFLGVMTSFVLIFGGFVIAGGLLGYLISLGVSSGAIKENCHDTKIPNRIGLICGFVGFGAYLLVYTLVIGVSVGFNSVIDFLKLGLIMIAILVASSVFSTSAIESTPFCDQCEEYMKPINFGRRTGAGEGVGWPIRYEEPIMNILQSRKFEELSKYGKDWVPKNYTSIFVWYCGHCRQKGFINAETTQMRYEVDTQGKRNAKYLTRTIFSSSLDMSEVEKLRTVAETLKL